MENVTNYTLQDLQTVLQTKLGLDLGKSGVDGKFGKMTKGAIIKALDMVKQMTPTQGSGQPTQGGETPKETPDAGKKNDELMASANTGGEEVVNTTSGTL